MLKVKSIWENDFHNIFANMIRRKLQCKQHPYCPSHYTLDKITELVRTGY